MVPKARPAAPLKMKMMKTKDLLQSALTSNQFLTQMTEILDRPAEEFVNDNVIEELWAIKAFEHAEIYFNLLSSIDPKILRLTKFDDVIYKNFREQFPDLKVGLLREEELKSAQAKENWRPFCENYKLDVEDYNYGTLFRLDSSKEYSESNSVVVPRVQFLALELARNREGFNDSIRENFKPKKLKTRS
uniref:EOG090X0HAI n=1 Tax=Eubosmina coregoni TaxID=186181 RepID=A0A4Y7LS58_9CRUS|nr:EOG090X0HAI [Eubosmina coregoni]SVE70153.1 EOG090X0HAI [Eubosmina coregoni]